MEIGILLNPASVRCCDVFSPVAHEPNWNIGIRNWNRPSGEEPSGQRDALTRRDVRCQRLAQPDTTQVCDVTYRSEVSRNWRSATGVSHNNRQGVGQHLAERRLLAILASCRKSDICQGRLTCQIGKSDAIWDGRHGDGFSAVCQTSDNPAAKIGLPIPLSKLDSHWGQLVSEREDPSGIRLEDLSSHRGLTASLSALGGKVR